LGEICSSKFRALMESGWNNSQLAVHLYWMWRQGLNYREFEKLGSHAGEPGHRHDGDTSST